MIWLLYGYLSVILFLVIHLYFNKLFWKQIKYVYIIYWHIIYINLVITTLVSIPHPELWSTIWWYDGIESWIIQSIFLVVFPWIIFYIKNFILVDYFGKKLNIFTQMLLDFIKMIIFYVYLITFLFLLEYTISIIL